MRYDLIVVGGGITGLSIAYIASKAGKKVLVIEASNSLGGLLSCFDIANTKLERYYHHFFQHDAEAKWLINELDLTEKLKFYKSSMGIYTNNKLFSFQNSGDLLRFSPISLIGRIQFGITSLFLATFANWKKYEHISALEWLNRRSGKKSTATIWSPMLSVKFGKFSKNVPLAWIIGRLKQRFSSRKSGDEYLGYLDGSLQVLLDTLIQKLAELDVDFKTNEPVASLTINDNEIKEVITDTYKYSATKVICTIPAPQIAKLIKPHHDTLYNQVKQIDYFGAICTVLELKKPFSEYYWINVADSKFPFGGIIEQTNLISSNIYNNTHVLYLSRYFTADEKIAQMDDVEIKAIMLQGLKNFKPDSVENSIKKVHVFKSKTAAVMCGLNFSTKIVNCKTPIKGFYVANMMHIYPDERSVNNSIRIAFEACKTIGYHPAEIPSGQSLAGQIGF